MVCIVRMRLNPKSAEVARDLPDAGRLRKRVLHGFGCDGTGTRGEWSRLLYRLDAPRDGTLLTVQCHKAPCWAGWPSGYILGDGGGAGGSGTAAWPNMELRSSDQEWEGAEARTPFRLRAYVPGLSPSFGELGGESEAMAVAWLGRQAAKSGFVVSLRGLSVRSHSVAAMAGWPPEQVVDYTGYLRIVVPARFMWQLERGIGGASQIGCGLLVREHVGRCGGLGTSAWQELAGSQGPEVNERPAGRDDPMASPGPEDRGY